MSEVRPQPSVCPHCEQEVCALDLWQCECGRVECCTACAQYVGEYHRSGECGLDCALDRVLAKEG
jgi:hypothetical protein